MRNLRVANFIRKLQYLNKTGSKYTYNQQLFKYHKSQNVPLTNIYRYHSSQHQQKNKSSFVIYSMFGAVVLGAMYSVIHITSNSNSKGESKSNRNNKVDSVATNEISTSVEEETEGTNKESEIEIENNHSEDDEKKSEAVVSTKNIESNSNNSYNEAKIPSHVSYLIIGGGTAAMSAFKAIRVNDAVAKVLVITEEEYMPYMRPPLSKDLWFTDDENLVSQLKFKQWNGNERSLFYLEDEFYVKPEDLNSQENGGVAVMTGRRVVKVNPSAKSVELNNGWEISYDKCLLATGGYPKNIQSLENPQYKEKVTLFRNISDFRKLKNIADQGKNIVIIGGGFLGSELACALANYQKKKGGKCVQIFPEAGNLGKILPHYLSQWATDKIRNEGVEVVPNTIVQSAKLDEDKIILNIESNKKADQPKPKWLVADHIVVAVGLQPNVELASVSGLELDEKLGGYLVNTELQARNSLWVAGDAACFYDTKLGRRRVEHHDHAVVSGRLAGENMTGQAKPYWHQSMFWSDLGPKISFEAIGLIDSSLETMGVFSKQKDTESNSVNIQQNPQNSSNDDQYNKGVLFYLKNDTVVGVLMWNVFNKISIARKILADQQKIKDYQEIAKLFDIDYSSTDQQQK